MNLKPISQPVDLHLTDKQIAERTTIQSFFNCYLRETGSGALSTPEDIPNFQQFNKNWDRLIRCPLPHQGIEIIAGLRYSSPTGRHLFHFPFYYKNTVNPEYIELDYVTLVALLSKELAIVHNHHASQDELLLRVVQSCRNIEYFIRERRQDAELLSEFSSNFATTEQALIFGHHLHPTPKSRQGFAEEDLPIYSPELKGSFSLHYFRLNPAIVLEGSALDRTATQAIKQGLLEDDSISEEFKQKYCQNDGYSLLPLHPWQAHFLLRQPIGQQLRDRGLLEDLGRQGLPYLPTSSIRTVYHPDRAFMFKLSLNVKITNSLRTNLYKELERSVEVYRLLDSEIGRELGEKFPQFQIIRDPAYLAVQVNGEPLPAFATILRENPFQTNPETDATCIISLCQDSIYSDGSRLAHIIRALVKRERRSSRDISLEWFRRYLDISLDPILWLYFTHGVAVEAHQQNSVLQLKNGYPDRFYYRDNQGYYFRQSYFEHLNRFLPGIGETSQTVCDDKVSDERLGYYFFQNNLFGLINAFGVAGLIDESLLLDELRSALERVKRFNPGNSKILENLSQPKLRCKANLMTRFHDMDELVGSLASQSVYVWLDNPLHPEN
ncbi:IucA/IucC family protein [Oxynema aestuarii]|uniref:IucA/IucC family siderophore biosynthesis protein n=1 Tax=Oxynema aestuarii AP17 TaxID=2064643 RepID=A0A6H1TVB3_9CYAN|nr:IucA/IucC family siderophore biosynthesis protein [Oxynema aestuarii]QIZ70548.1 IucA/IucC family siderophore biosynthesis protein [Oxynema aestuarii AP17]